MKKRKCEKCKKDRWSRKPTLLLNCLPCRGGNPKRAPRFKAVKHVKTAAPVKAAKKGKKKAAAQGEE